MTYEERSQYILKAIDRTGNVQVAELSKELNYSEVTIRNDIRRMDSEGLLKRIYGGAVRTQNQLKASFDPGEYHKSKAEKSRIALRAFEFIRDRDTIAIDDSTTSAYLAALLVKETSRHVAVVTNSIYCAACLANAKHVELFTLGGLVTGNPPSALDNYTVAAIKQYHISKAFVGANGINLEDGIYAMGMHQRDVKRAMIEASEHTYVMADHTKFGGGNLFKICNIEEIDCIITDEGLDLRSIELASKLMINLDIV